MHSRNGFSRQRMNPQSATEFDAALRELVALFTRRKMAEFEVVTGIVCDTRRRPPRGRVGDNGPLH